MVMKALGLPPGDPSLTGLNGIQWRWLVEQLAADRKERQAETDLYFFSALMVINPERGKIIKEQWDDLDEDDPEERRARIWELFVRMAELRRTGGAGQDDDMADMLARRRETRRDGRESPTSGGVQLDEIETPEDILGDGDG